MTVLNKAKVIVLMGVSGSGKSTIGALLGQRLGWRFEDADKYHPEINIRKMSDGIALTDEDRLPWLWALRKEIETCLHEDERVILACSALKRSYREILIVDAQRTVFVYLKAQLPVLLKRLQERTNHFMKASMLTSQLATLEEPLDAIVIDIQHNPDEIVEQIVRQLQLEG